jgi:UDP-N-acetylmuramate--alanine ligase
MRVADGTDGTTVDLSRPMTVHVVGVGGAGMSAIAGVLVAMGHRVSGSDLKRSPGTDRLGALGVTVHIGHDAANLADADVVAISTAIPERNPEVVAARERGIPVLRRAEILAAMTALRRTIAVGGTHGKTTTSSMLGLALLEAGMHPSFIIGGDLNEIGSGAAWDAGDLFVVEADESDGTFLELDAHGVIVTNVEPDHLEHYGGFDRLRAAFEAFAAAAGGPRVMCADDAECLLLAERLRARGAGVVTYGVHPGADYRMADVQRHRTGISLTVHRRSAEPVVLRLPVPGLHNARNAVAALAMACELGASVDAVCAALGRYGGVARRFEFRGGAAGITFVDDYAHLPTEVAAAIGAARDGEWPRVVCVFQPHRYSRTEALWSTFGDAFEGADLLVVTDVYPSGEKPRPGVTGKLIVNAVLDAHPWRRVAYLPRHDDVVAFLRAELRSGDLCLTLGAGDLTTLPDELLGLLGVGTGVRV